jgi:hypothetical protein
MRFENSHRFHARPSGRPAAWLLAMLLVCALLLAQTLGFMHGVVHGPQLAAARKAAVQLQAAPLADKPAHDWVAALFYSHQGDNDCRLYDQASHGSAAVEVAGAALPMLVPTLAVAFFNSEALARWAALFDARGPPLTR